MRTKKILHLLVNMCRRVNDCYQYKFEKLLEFFVKNVIMKVSWEPDKDKMTVYHLDPSDRKCLNEVLENIKKKKQE